MEYLLNKMAEADLAIKTTENRIKAQELGKKEALDKAVNETQKTKIAKEFDSKIRNLMRERDRLLDDYTHYKARTSYLSFISDEKFRIETEQKDITRDRKIIIQKNEIEIQQRTSVRNKISAITTQFQKEGRSMDELKGATLHLSNHSRDLTLRIIKNRQMLDRLKLWEENLEARRTALEELPEEDFDFDDDGGEIDIPSEIEELQEQEQERCEDCDKIMEWCDICEQTYCEGEECPDSVECKRCKRKACPWCAYQDELCHMCLRKKKKKKKRADMSIPDAIFDVLSDAEDWMTAKEITREIKRRRLVKKDVLIGKTPHKSVRREINENKKTYEIHPTISGLYRLRGRSFEDETVDMAIPRTLIPEVIDLIEDEDEDPVLPPLMPSRALDDLEVITGEKREREEEDEDDDDDDEEREKKKRKLKSLIRAHVKAEKRQIIKRIKTILTQVTSKYKLVKK
jgi:hypothetical protein